MDKQNVLKQYQNIYTDENGLVFKMREIHRNDPFVVSDYIEHNSKVCFVFSCPGQDELINDQVCHGKTGENLDVLLKILHDKKAEIFSSDNRYEYDILNASNIVHFYALDNKTEADSSEIKQNIQRIFNYVDENENLSYVILFGKKAESIKKDLKRHIKKSQKNIKVIFNIPHLGFRSINQINIDSMLKKDEHSKTTSEERTRLRLEIVAEKILSQMK